MQMDLILANSLANKGDSPHSMSMNISVPDPAIAELDRVYRRTDLPSRAGEIALDLTALLGRLRRGH
jgi:hypothetical protein